MNMGQYKQVVRVSLPLVVSMGATTVMEFTDRVFLGNYSLDALAASLPAGITSFVFTAFFMGVAGYTNVFIAQFTGAKSPEGVGSSLWQGLYFSLAGAMFMACLAWAADPLFDAVGHAPAVRHLETVYFRIICLGTGLSLVGTTLSCFFSGRGFTGVVMLITIAGTLVNIPLDYALINGRWGFPELGIAGAALATVASWGLMAGVFGFLIFTRDNNRRFHVWLARRFNPELFLRLLRFGVPGGVQFFMDVLAFVFFILMVGRIGTLELAVTNLAMSINAMSYMPMYGFSMGVSILVGQAMGSGDTGAAVRAASATVRLALVYALVLAVVFVLFPDPLIRLFISRETLAGDTASILVTGRLLLRFVAVYMVFDALGVIYTGVLKGAGDTAYVMGCMVAAGAGFLFVPVLVGRWLFDVGLFFVWTCITIYLMALFAMIYIRYLRGPWKSIQVVSRDSSRPV
ncbi:MAG: MATE family efflux transporter [Pseudomonadota bacterium]